MASYAFVFPGQGSQSVGMGKALADLAAWLACHEQSVTCRPCDMPVAIARTVVDAAYVECAGRRIDGLPMFDSPPTDSDGIAGTLCALDGTGDIGCLEMPPNAASIKHMRFEKIRRAATQRALVVATRVTGESLAPINAQYYDAPFGPPALLIAGSHHEWLMQNAKAAAQARFVCAHHREATDSFNIDARITAGNDAAPLVVVTPRTGWWESTAERAGGLVAWIASIEAAAQLKSRQRLACDVRTYATCGHELGHLGLSEFIRREPALMSGARHFLHLGANLGCASDLTLYLRAAEPEQSQRMRELLIESGYPADHILVQSIDVVSGEGRDLTEHGATVLSMAGANAHFHAASDRWPGNVNAAGTAAIARAVARWTEITAA